MITTNFKINLEQIKKGAISTISYQKNKICVDCNGQGGIGKKGCTSCGGSGTKMLRPNPSTIQQITCSVCHGKGILLDKPCQTCQTNGFVQRAEQITIKIEEEK